MRSIRLTAVISTALLAAGCASAPPASAPSTPTVATNAAASPSQAAYERFAREFLDWYYAADPVRATSLGLHAGDARMADVSRAGIDRRTRELHGWLDRLQTIDRAGLRGDAWFDWLILDHAIRAQLLELEEVRGWERDPGFYSGTVAYAVSTLSSREFAPLPARMEAMIARMDGVPALLASARANLRNPPRMWVDDAVGGTRGTVTFLRRDLPAALAAQGFASVEAGLRARFQQAVDRAVGELEGYAAWLQADLAPRASGDFRLGKDVFERKVTYEEFVDLSAEQLRDVNERAIVEYQAWVAREAARIDRARSHVQIVDSITRVHPTPETLISTARAQLDTIKRFIVQRGIVTLPSDRMPTVRETPPYARSGFASMDTPGPFETVATEAFYNITNVDPAWTPEQKAQHLTYFNYPGLLGITVHEAMPGHFVQLLYMPQIPTEVRKVFIPASVVEGWAHYTEQMMIDEGLGGGDPGARLGQLRRALQRHARWHAGLSMHAFGDSIEGAAKRFEQIAYFAPFPALRETQRGTHDPTYLYYALGRMQILKLRDDYRRYLESRGQTFSLRDFHDRFLRLGLPVSLARQALIPGDTGPSL